MNIRNSLVPGGSVAYSAVLWFSPLWRRHRWDTHVEATSARKERHRPSRLLQKLPWQFWPCSKESVSQCLTPRLHVTQIFRTAAGGDVTSPRSFGSLVGKMKQQKASNDAAGMTIMKQR